MLALFHQSVQYSTGESTFSTKTHGWSLTECINCSKAVNTFVQMNVSGLDRFSTRQNSTEIISINVLIVCQRLFLSLMSATAHFDLFSVH